MAARSQSPRHDLGVILALLYLGRSVLIPLALAIMLSLLVAPFVRGLRRIVSAGPPQCSLRCDTHLVMREYYTRAWHTNPTHC